MPTTATAPQPRTGEPRLASFASWAVLAASFGLSASTWIALAVLAGFTAHLAVAGLTLRLAWLMPIAVDGYVVVALVLWMAPVPARVAVFAKKNTYGAAGIGICAQSAYHLLFTMSTTGQGWRVVLAAIVGALPPAVAGLAVHMRALIRRENTTTTLTATAATAVPVPVRSEPPSPTTTVPDPTPMPPVPVPPAPVHPASVSPAPVVAVPSPAEVAPRITAAPTIDRPRPAPVPGPTAPPVRSRPTTSQTPDAIPVPPSTDIHVTAQAATALAHPIVSPTLLDRATHAAEQYHTEHGTPITAGRLAVRLKVTSDLAAQLLARINHNPTTPAPSVNGHRIQAAR